MHVDEVSLLEKLVDGVGDQGAHAEHGLERVGSGTQVGDGAQILQAVALLLKRIVGAGCALHGDLRGLDLEGLLRLRGGHQGSLHDDGGSHVHVADLIEVCKIIVVNHL